MKKILFVCVALVLVAGFATPAAEAQQCLKWDAFCDGVQIDLIAGDTISASWYNYDCANSWPGMIGKVGIPGGVNGCAGSGNAAVLSRTSDGSPVGDYTFIIDSLDGTIDMNQGVPPGALGCRIDELAYTHSLGACTGSLAPDSPQNVPSTR